MKDKKSEHRHGRNPRGFESHVVRSSAGHGGYERKGKFWRFYDAGRSYPNPLEPHFRNTSRLPALPGKHMRRKPEPARASHGKDA